MERINLLGRQFGRWTVVAYAGIRPDGRAYWLCRCDCGREKAVSSASLRDGRSTSCGCRRNDLLRADLTGMTFHHLTVIKLAGFRKTSSGNRSDWLCRCSCGKEVVVLGSSLAYGSTKSCGRCSMITHGEASGAYETTEYRSWAAMWSRCQNPKHESWDNYGGRGIAVCERWKSYKTFLADMGRKPEPSYSIERIDVNGNYEPSNCRWASKKDQIANRRPFKTGSLRSFTDAELLAELQRRGN